MKQKKDYIKPEIMIVELKPQQMLTGSIPKHDDWTNNQW